MFTQETGYTVGDNLIITMEGQSQPLNTRNLDKVIRKKFDDIIKRNYGIDCVTNGDVIRKKKVKYWNEIRGEIGNCERLPIFEQKQRNLDSNRTKFFEKRFQCYNIIWKEGKE